MKKLVKTLMVAGLAFSMFGCSNKDKEDFTIQDYKPSSTTNKDTNNTDSNKLNQNKDNKDTNTNKNDQGVAITPGEESYTATTPVYQADASKFPKGQYVVAMDGINVRKRTNSGSTSVYSELKRGDLLNVIAVKTGEKDPSTVWGKIEAPVFGWVCIADTANGYLLTTQEWLDLGETLENSTPTEELPTPTPEENQQSQDPSEKVEEETVVITPVESATFQANKGDGVEITVVLEWSGEPANRLNEISNLDLTIVDPDGQAHAQLNQQNNWIAKFIVSRGVEFDFDLSFESYPFVKQVSTKWDSNTNTLIYYVS